MHTTAPMVPPAAIDPAAATPIVGFDVVGRVWVAAQGAHGGYTPLPPLVGRLFVDAAAQAGMDVHGRHGHLPIAAMLLPGHVRDIVRMMRFCNEHRIRLACARGADENGDGGPVVRVHAPGRRPVLRVVGVDGERVAGTGMAR